MEYDAMQEGYEKSLKCQAYRYCPEVSVRTEKVGNWIVSAKILGGCQGVICIYNADTLMEHYKTSTIGLSCNEDAPENVKAFYKRAFDRDFRSVVELAEKWN